MTTSLPQPLHEYNHHRLLHKVQSVQLYYRIYPGEESQTLTHLCNIMNDWWLVTELKMIFTASES